MSKPEHPIDIAPITDAERARWPAQPVVDLEKAFQDVRGEIQPLVDEMMRSAVWIQSRQGAIRANHYHKTDWHYCYVVSGSMEYFHRPSGSQERPERLVVGSGSMIFTPPMVDHAMKFPEDSIFLTLGRNYRDQATYEADVVRVEMIDPTGSLAWRPGDDQDRG